MAARLSVIMVHTPPPTAIAGQIVESIVGELIGLSGIDLTLIGPIAMLGESSTDRLTLDSLSGDVAVLDWQRPLDSIADLARIGFQGQRSPHAHDSEALPPSGNLRRVYAFDLNQFSAPGDVIAALAELKSSRQVRTFPLELTPRASKPADKSAQRSLNSSSTTSPSSSVASPDVARSGIPKPPPSRESAEPKPRETLNLDDLLDQLDQLDP